MLLFRLKCFILIYSCMTIYSYGLRNDFTALKVPIVFEDQPDNRSLSFSLNYSQLPLYTLIAEQFAKEIQTDEDNFIESVFQVLKDRQYPPSLLDNNRTNDGGLDSFNSTFKLLKVSTTNGLFDILPGASLSAFKPREISSFKETETTDQEAKKLLLNILHDRKISSIPNFLRSKRRIIIYKTIGANTGGTTAMILLHQMLLDLGYDALLCRDENRYSVECTRPTDDMILVTGEWCNEVFSEYWNNPSTPPINGTSRDYQYRGRGVQYHLGFHHAPDSCTGFVAVAHSHYISKLLGSKVLGGYYLGCPMSPRFKEALVELLLLDIEGENSNDLVNNYVSVEKEDLIVLDPDFSLQYPPENALDPRVPPGYRVLYAQDISPKEMPLLFQRAKIVMDLALPGAERLVSEGVLFGVIPVISNRWTGSSTVDFPGVRRVDHQNATDINEVLQDIAKNYERELENVKNAHFFSYIVSMWQSVPRTVDIFFGSSNFHFVLTAETLHEEYIANFQLLSLFFLFPLCSIDLYVVDVTWYMRHHYQLFSQLKASGYVRIDPFIPHEFHMWKNETLSGQSFVRIRSLNSLKDELKAINNIEISGDGTTNSSYGLLKESNLIPDWNPIMIVLPIGVTFQDADSFFSFLLDFQDIEKRVIGFKNDKNTSSSMLMLIVSPFFLVSRCSHDFLSIVENKISPTVESTVENNYTNKSMGNFFDYFITVCNLFNSKENKDSGDIIKKGLVINDIVYSIGWSNYKQFASETDFNCI